MMVPPADELHLSRLLYSIGRIILYVAWPFMITVSSEFRSDDVRSIPWKRISLWACWSIAASFWSLFSATALRNASAILYRNSSQHFRIPFSLAAPGGGVQHRRSYYALAWPGFSAAKRSVKIACRIGPAARRPITAMRSDRRCRVLRHWPRSRVAWIRRIIRCRIAQLPAAFSEISCKNPGVSSIVRDSHALMSPHIAAIAVSCRVREILDDSHFDFLIGAATLVGDWGSAGLAQKS